MNRSETQIHPGWIWQTTALDCAVAEEFFGWRWYSYVGRPVRSHPEYPKEMRVRRFYPPLKSLSKQWQDYFKRDPHEPANGDEPLCYCYESSNGPHMVPHFSGHASAIQQLEKELAKRGLFDQYQQALAVFIESKDASDLALAACDAKCIAALAIVRSRHIDLEAFDESMKGAGA